MNKFSNIYEPSGITQLDDGQFLIVEDDGENPLLLVKSQYRKSHIELFKVKGFKFRAFKVDDLEAITHDKKNQLYAISSHSLKENGKYNKNRGRLIQFSFNQQSVKNIRHIENLREWASCSYPQLKKSFKIKKVQKKGGFNIEALACDNKHKQLLIGLRSPLDKKNLAIIIPIALNKQTFKNKQFSAKPLDLITLDLDGAGIRDFAFIKHLNAVVILSGTSLSKNKKKAALWLWKRGEKPVKIKAKGVDSLSRAEGICAAQLLAKKADKKADKSLRKVVNNLQGLMIMIDDGDEQKKKVGHYLFIPYKHLKLTTAKQHL